MFFPFVSLRALTTLVSKFGPLAVDDYSRIKVRALSPTIADEKGQGIIIMAARIEYSEKYQDDCFEYR